MHTCYWKFLGGTDDTYFKFKPHSCNSVVSTNEKKKEIAQQDSFY